MLKTINGGISPTRGSEFSACVDLYARNDVIIGAGETALVPLGVKIDLEYIHSFIDEHTGSMGDLRIYGDKDDYGKHCQEMHNKNFKWFMGKHQLNLHIRSSMSAKHGLVIANGTGIIDLDYEDEIMICLHKPINKGDDFEIAGHLVGFNDDDFGHQIKKGDKVAQISLVEHKTYLLGVESKDKRNGGFGSSGE